MTPADKQRLRRRLEELFSPTAPVAVEDLFAGRKDQLRRLSEAVSQRGRHAIVYGERGVGKTSLGQIFIGSLGPESYGVAPLVSCDSTDSFDSVWRKVFVKVPNLWEGSDAPPTEGTAADTLPSDQILTPDWIRHYLAEFGQTRTLVVVIDEFENFPDNGQRRLFAETIKLLSDRSVPVTVVLMGVADDVSSLLANHASVERNITQVYMPRMSRPELQEIIDKALGQAGMSIEPQAAQRITFLSQGLPHYTHLLGLEAGHQAVEDGSKLITLDHFRRACRSAIGGAQASLRSSYHRATVSSRPNSLLAPVLLACALAPVDEQGFFAARDVKRPMHLVTGQTYAVSRFGHHLLAFCDPDRGSILQRVGEKKHGYRFRFTNPLFQPFVNLKGIADGKIDDDLILE